MKRLLKSFKNGIFSCRRQQSVWGGGEQDTQSPCLPVSCLPTPHTALRRQHSQTSGGGGAEEATPRAGLGRKEVGSRLGWGDGEGVQAGFGQPSVRLPLCI